MIFQCRKDSEREFSDFGDFSEHQDDSTKEEFAEFESCKSTDFVLTWTSENQAPGNIKRKISLEKVSLSNIPSISNYSGLQFSPFSNTIAISTSISTDNSTDKFSDLQSYSSPETQLSSSLASTVATVSSVASFSTPEDLFNVGNSDFANFADFPITTNHNDFLNNQFSTAVTFFQC